MTYLLSLISFSPLMLDKIQTNDFSISKFQVKFLINKNYHNYWGSNDTDMKLRPISKLEKKNTMVLKK